MIRRQNSEKIFLQPIDQHYDNIKNLNEESLDNKMFDDYDHNMIDYLNMSTDSETHLSRQDSMEKIINDLKITNSLNENWSQSINQFKNCKLVYMKNIILHKIAFLRGSLNNLNNANNLNTKIQMNNLNYDSLARDNKSLSANDKSNFIGKNENCENICSNS